MGELNAGPVLMTGASGFIGGAVLRELIKRQVPTLLLARPGSRLPAGSGPLVQTFTANRWRPDDESLVAAIKAHAPRAFIHCAWQGVGGSERNQASQVQENIPFTLDTVALAHRAGCSHWVGLGSQAEYGNRNQVIAETEPPHPTTVYGHAKLAAGIAAQGLCQAFGLSFAWLRVFSTYGPGDAPYWFIPYIISELTQGKRPRLTACEQRWDYLYVDDAARAVAEVATARTAGVFNLGSGTANPLRTVVELIRRELGTAVEPEYGAIPYRTDQVMHLQADIRRLNGATGWRPEVDLPVGIKRTVAAWKNPSLSPS